MKFINVRDLRTNTGEVWKKLQEAKDLIITLNGQPIALLTGISEVDLETMLAAVRQARARSAIHKLRQNALERGLQKTSMTEIEREIKRVRQENQA